MEGIWIYEDYKDHELEKKLSKILSNKSLINRVVKIIGLFNFIKKNNINTFEKLQKKFYICCVFPIRNSKTREI